MRYPKHSVTYFTQKKNVTVNKIIDSFMEKFLNIEKPIRAKKLAMSIK